MLKGTTLNIEIHDRSTYFATTSADKVDPREFQKNLFNGLYYFTGMYYTIKFLTDSNRVLTILQYRVTSVLKK